MAAVTSPFRTLSKLSVKPEAGPWHKRGSPSERGSDMHGLGLLKSAVSRAFTSGRQALASLLLFSLVLTTPALASGQAETIVRLSPLGPIVEQSQAMMRTGIRDGLMATGQVDSLVAETIAGFGASAFDAARIRARLVNDLTADLASDELQTVNEWY